MPANERGGRAPLLHALHDDIAAAEYRLEQDRYTIGRSSSCAVVVNRKNVSRLHAEIERQGTRYVISDAGSANGTFVNGRRISEACLLQNGSEIGLGGAEPLLRFEDPEATEAPRRRLWFDDRLHCFVYEGATLQLSKNLRQLLMHLYQNAGSTCSHESCIQAIWGRVADDDYAMLLHREVNDLRRALKQLDPQAAELIANVRGVGYRLEI